MSGDATRSQGRDASLALNAADLETEFRVVTSDGIRRGLRLERLFWRTLRERARRDGVTIGRMVADLVAANPSAANVSSLVRGACVDWLARENGRLGRLVSKISLGAILSASAAPTFVLSADRRIVAFNAGFQLLVRRQFPEADGRVQASPRLALDVPIADIAARLVAEGASPVRTGFAIGLAERRLRGVLNVVRAPSLEGDLLLAFVAAVEPA
ncbi:MAG: ribbon-helix-helix domain-containing protein [Rhizobiaceae bacterium]